MATRNEIVSVTAVGLGALALGWLANKHAQSNKPGAKLVDLFLVGSMLASVFMKVNR